MLRLHRHRVRSLIAVVLIGVPSASVRAAGNDGHPLDPPDLSSPRATLASFVERTDRLYAALQRAEPTADRTMVIRQAITSILACLDTQEIARSLQDSKGREAAVCLKEVLDRIDLPPAEEIPDADAVEHQKLTRWRLPRTEIAIIRLSEGERAGEWVFSGDTVERAEEFFSRVQDMPCRPDAGSPGLYDFYVDAAGWMIPRAWVQGLPPWARSLVLGEAVWRWIALGTLLGAGGFVVGGLFRWSARASRRGGLLAHVLACAAPVSLVAASLVGDYLLTSQVRFTGQPLFLMKASLRVVAFGGGILLLLAVLQRAAELVIHARGFRPGTIGMQLVRLGFKVLTVVAVAWMVIVAADYLGISVAPLLAGFGVGGLAVALAAQHTFENVIAGIMLFADAPVRIGDFCQFGDLRGTVEQIGLRSTRIRSFDRTVISIPNSEFAKLKLVNFSRRDRILFKAPISLRYETTGDQLRYVLAILRNMLETHPRLVPESVRARFIGYGNWSLDVELYALAETSDYVEFLAIQEDVLLRVMDLVLEAGCGFAFPSQTFYQAADTAPDAARAHAVAAQVAAWRRHDGLRAAGFLDTRPNAAEVQVCPLPVAGPQAAPRAA
jgi:MscS family membrane protein